MIAPFFGVGHLLALIARAPRDGFSWPYQAAARRGRPRLCADRRSSSSRRCSDAGSGERPCSSRCSRRPSGRACSTTRPTTRCSVMRSRSLSSPSSCGSPWNSPIGREPSRPPAWLRQSACWRSSGRPTSTSSSSARCTASTTYATWADASTRSRATRVLWLWGAECSCWWRRPQIAYWHAITGQLVANGYVGEHLELLRPHLLEVLFSVRKGLFFWTPLLLLAVAGVPFLRRFAPGLFVPTIAYLAVHTWIVASWSTWWYGGSFGMRPFVEALPILAMPLAALLAAATSVWARRLVLIGVTATTLLAVHAMIAYWTKAVPLDETTFRSYLRSFWDLSARNRGRGSLTTDRDRYTNPASPPGRGPTRSRPTPAGPACILGRWPRSPSEAGTASRGRVPVVLAAARPRSSSGSPASSARTRRGTSTTRTSSNCGGTRPSEGRSDRVG